MGPYALQKTMSQPWSAKQGSMFVVDKANVDDIKEGRPCILQTNVDVLVALMPYKA